MRFALSLIGGFVLACASCWAQAEQQEVRHHGMMHAADTEHPISKTAKLTVTDNSNLHEMTVRIGPVSLPADTEPAPLAQPPMVWLTIPFEGWLTAYHPSIVDGKGRALPNKLLRHAALYDTAQSDLVCQGKEEHIFGAGPEMSDWPAISGYGYRVHKDDRIRITTVFDNTPEKNYHDVFLQLRIEYQLASSDTSKFLRDIYPAWFNVTECGESGYDLSPGESTRTGQFKLRYSGKLLGVGGRLHNYGQWLVLKNDSTKQTIATLEADLDAKGRVVGVPVESFAERGGVPVHSGDLLTVTDAYDNPTGRLITDGAAGIIVGYFLPDQESQLTAARPVDERPQTR